LNPVDYNGAVCGYDSMKHLKYGYYLLDKSLVCVSDCPSENDYDSFICHYDVQAALDNATAAGDYASSVEYITGGECFFEVETEVCK
jgi:hypothetical protein